MTHFDVMHMSCQCFAQMLIHFHLENFRHLICPIFSKCHAKILYDLDGSNSLEYTVQAIMSVMIMA
jgi:hypothetical protein